MIEWSITLMVLLHNIWNNKFDFVFLGRIGHNDNASICISHSTPNHLIGLYL